MTINELIQIIYEMKDEEIQFRRDCKHLETVDRCYSDGYMEALQDLLDRITKWGK